MCLSESAGGLKLNRMDSITVVFHYAASAPEVYSDVDCSRICIQGILDQFQDHPVQISD